MRSTFYKDHFIPLVLKQTLKSFFVGDQLFQKAVYLCFRLNDSFFVLKRSTCVESLVGSNKGSCGP